MPNNDGTYADTRQARSIDRWVFPISVVGILCLSGFLITCTAIYVTQANDYKHTSQEVIELKREVNLLKEGKSSTNRNIAIINTKVKSIEGTQTEIKQAQDAINQKLDRLIALYPQKKNV